jgi:hypothetical protein
VQTFALIVVCLRRYDQDRGLLLRLSLKLWEYGLPFILDLDELDYIEFLHPSDPDFAEELDERAAEAEVVLENLRDIEVTLRGLDRGKIKIQ